MGKLPPGPRGRLLTTYRCLAKPFEFMPKWLAQYGDPFLVSAVNGKVAVTGDPKLIRQIFSANPNNFDPFAPEATAPLVGPKSVFLLTGDEHKRERKLLMPPFHGERMRAYGDIIVNTTKSHLQQACDGKPIKAIDITQAISLEVIIRAVFGVQDDVLADSFAEAVRRLTGSVSPLFIFAPFMQRRFFGIGPYDRYLAAYDHLDKLLQQQIERTRENPGEDILSLLLSARYEDDTPMPDSSIRDELRTLLFAGHESTALTLAWLVDLTHRTPGVLDKLRHEIAELGEAPAPDQLARLTYLEAACKEAMRMYPITTEVLRSLREPMELGGYTMPAGTAVSPSILLAHYSEDLYPEPTRFRPERFLERRYSAFEFLPFGGGMRRCIGAAFAMYELKLVTATILANFDIELCDANPPKAIRRSVTLAPKGGVPIRVKQRKTG